MSRMLSPDDACRGVTLPVGTGRQRYGGQSIDVSEPSHIKALRQVGYTIADTSGAPVRRGGYHCDPCGFASYFRLCSRCGAECERPDLVA